MWASSWLPIGVLVSYLREYSPMSSNDQLTWAAEIEEAEEVEIFQAMEFQSSHSLADSSLEASFSLESHGYIDVDLHGGIIGILSERYSQNGELVLELFIDTETQVLTIFENNLQYEEDETDSLQLHEIIQALFLERDMDVNEIKWAAVSIDEPLARMASRDYRKANGLEPNEDIKIAATDPSWSMFSSTSSYESASQIVPGAQIDRMVVANSRPLGSNGKDQSVLSVMLMLSFKMPSDGDSAPIDVIEELAAQHAAEDNLKDGLHAAINALDIHLKYLRKVFSDREAEALEEVSSDLDADAVEEVSSDREADALEESWEVISGPISVTA
ncbi:hypothetical protein CFO_g1478 [Ceratocystis platani]|uniref:Uncharacterized protein n=1 Tax=Ceratocystis fimbriata f. sp. platani TaxID=88771 RepID=A0A0F8DJU7_CERFI|nr:hypothetical protein CFO_g1478 [Ceratocystis platani]